MTRSPWSSFRKTSKAIQLHCSDASFTKASPGADLLSPAALPTGQTLLSGCITHHPAGRPSRCDVVKGPSYWVLGLYKKKKSLLSLASVNRSTTIIGTRCSNRSNFTSQCLTSKVQTGSPWWPEGSNASFCKAYDYGDNGSSFFLLGSQPSSRWA